MGTVGDCYDNAPMESFWGSMQIELLNRPEVADQDRAGDRHGRVDRALLQPRAPAQRDQLRPPERIRGSTLGVSSIHPDLTLTTAVRKMGSRSGPKSLFRGEFPTKSVTMDL